MNFVKPPQLQDLNFLEKKLRGEAELLILFLLARSLVPWEVRARYFPPGHPAVSWHHRLIHATGVES